ncbi:hypothetical protein [Bradyrhizobium canariense]|uniref:Uncharacterized protein n=1 Tax=Bradyrhizobium canariense TaxID=255045 RepID=A0A1H1VRM3_9BRAD|nr:hypothetical protein [Bradyrhizobium canariense]SDS87403.1 hypothetical protein SAMN05444158_3523 [Bradyrhizobium canariense]
MTKISLMRAGVIAVAMLATPAMAQEAIQEPGAMGQNYPDSNYLTGGYGVRGTPGPGFYYRHGYAPGVAVEVPSRVIIVAPAEAAGPYTYEGPGPYAYYNGPDY